MLLSKSAWKEKKGKLVPEDPLGKALGEFDKAWSELKKSKFSKEIGDLVVATLKDVKKAIADTKAKLLSNKIMAATHKESIALLDQMLAEATAKRTDLKGYVDKYNELAARLAALVDKVLNDLSRIPLPGALTKSFLTTQMATLAAVIDIIGTNKFAVSDYTGRLLSNCSGLAEQLRLLEKLLDKRAGGEAVPDAKFMKQYEALLEAIEKTKSSGKVAENVVRYDLSPG